MTIGNWRIRPIDQYHVIGQITSISKIISLTLFIYSDSFSSSCYSLKQIALSTYSTWFLSRNFNQPARTLPYHTNIMKFFAQFAVVAFSLTQTTLSSPPERRGTSTSVATVCPNPIQDPGFENGRPPTPWTVTTGALVGHEAYPNPGLAHSGSWCY